MRTILQISSLLFIAAAATTVYVYFKSAEKSKPSFGNFKGTGRSVIAGESAEKNTVLKKLKGKGESLQSFARRNEYNAEISFLVDMSRESGSERFFVFNMEKDSIETAGLVTHGYGSSPPDGLSFPTVAASRRTWPARPRRGSSSIGGCRRPFRLHG